MQICFSGFEGSVVVSKKCAAVSPLTAEQRAKVFSFLKVFLLKQSQLLQLPSFISTVLRNQINTNVSIRYIYFDNSYVMIVILSLLL